MAEKTVKAKQPEEKPKQVQKSVKPADKDHEKPKQPNSIQKWYRETLGELRKVAWPTVPETRRLTGIVLIVMLVMSMILGILDFVFSKLITSLLS